MDTQLHPDRWPLTGHPEIDRQHAELRLVIADLAGHRLLTRSRVNAILADLVRQAEAHFAYEEGLMQDSAYPAAAHHRIAHRDIMGRLLQVEDALRTGLEPHRLLDGVVDLWLRHHVSAADANLVRHLGSGGTA